MTDLQLSLQNAAVAEQMKNLACARALEACLDRRYAAVRREGLAALRRHCRASREEAEPEAEASTSGLVPHPELQRLEESHATVRRFETAMDRGEAVAQRLENAVAVAEVACQRQAKGRAQQQ